jgi:hypothetical protein
MFAKLIRSNGWHKAQADFDGDHVTSDGGTLLQPDGNTKPFSFYLYISGGIVALLFLSLLFAFRYTYTRNTSIPCR